MGIYTLNTPSDCNAVCGCCGDTQRRGNMNTCEACCSLVCDDCTEHEGDDPLCRDCQTDED